MKRLILTLLLVFCMMLFGACGEPPRHTPQTPQTEESTEAGNEDENAYGYETELCNDVVIDVITSGGGTCMLLSDVEIQRSEDRIVGFTIDSPAVLAFRVPDRYPEGVGTIDGRDVEYIIEELMVILSEEENLSDDTVTALEDVLGKMKDVVVLTGAST